MRSRVISSFWCWNGLGNKSSSEVYFLGIVNISISDWSACWVLPCAWLEDTAVEKAERSLFPVSLNPRGLLLPVLRALPHMLPFARWPCSSSHPDRTSFPLHRRGGWSCGLLRASGVWADASCWSLKSWASFSLLFSLCVRSASLGRRCPFTLEFTHAPPPSCSKDI